MSVSDSKCLRLLLTALFVTTSVLTLHACAPSPSHSPVHNAPAPASWFEERSQAAGVAFTSGHQGKTPLTLLETIGIGCALFDYDGDGHVDLFLVGQPMGGQPGRCALYHNRGDGTFEDMTRGSGLEQDGFYTGCAVADIDNDGRPDLLVTGYGVMRLYHNLGGGKFQDITKGSGLEAPSATSWATSAAFADFDRDGKIDVYVGRYVEFNAHTKQFCNDRGTLLTACGPKMYDPQRGNLYRNLGKGRFKDVTRELGLDRAHGKCLGVAWADVNGDGWPDLYLGNDEMPGDLFINQRGKAFTEEGASRGVALTEEGKAQGAMGVDWGDINRNGKLDLAVSAFQFEGTSLYMEMEGGLYENRSASAGLGQATRPYVGFGMKMADFDNDGWLDIAQANGHVYDNEDKIDSMSHYRQPIQLFMNNQKGSFTDCSQQAGPGFTTPCVGRALAIGDLDEDGRLDVVVTDLEGRVRLLYNRIPTQGRNWVRIRLEGTRSNRMGIGARVTVIAGNQRWQAEATVGGSYLSASDVRVHIGLGTVQKIDRIEVRWPSGKQSVLESPRTPGDITIKEP